MNKRFAVVVAIASLLTPTMVPAAHGQEEGRIPAGNQPSSKKDSAAIAKLIDDINAAARTNKQRMLSIIVINTDVAASTLEQEKTQTGLTLGDVYVAHSLALAARKKVSAIFAMHKSGKSWSEIATLHNVRLKGSSELIKEMQKQ